MQFFFNNERKKKYKSRWNTSTCPNICSNVPYLFWLYFIFILSKACVFFSCSFRISMRPDIHVQSFSLKFIWKDIILKSIVRLLSSCNLYRHTGAQNAKNYYIKICAVCNLTRYIWSDEMQDMGNSTKIKKRWKRSFFF